MLRTMLLSVLPEKNTRYVIVNIHKQFVQANMSSEGEFPLIKKPLMPQ